MTVDVHKVVSEKVSEILKESRQFPPVERLTLAKLLLESVLTEELDAGAEWSALGLEAFQREWGEEEESGLEEWDETEWLQAAARNPAFEFLKEPEEDIYSLEDGKPFHDQA